MASNSNKAPKQWPLTKTETLNTYNNWKANIIYTLSLDQNFTPFLANNATWEKETTANPNRGLQDDAADATNRKTKEQKVIQLNLMLGVIANYATVISRNQIIKESTSLASIWSKLRLHYGFQTTGSRFLDLSNIQLSVGERPEDLYQRLLTFFDDNLLTTESSITHHSNAITANEEITPTMENMTVLIWLERIHVGLPGLIKQRYGTELRNRTLASIKPEISQALSSLLEELRGADESRIMRTQTNYSRNTNNSNSNRTSRSCCLCRAARRPGAETHFLSQCRFLPESDRRMVRAPPSARIRGVEAIDGEDAEVDYHEDSYEDNLDTQDNTNFIDNPAPSIQRRVLTRRSPYMNVFYNEIPVRLCLDSGAESNLMSHRFAIYIEVAVEPTRQGAVQADESTPLNIIGEVKGITLKRGAHSFSLDALVTRDDVGDVIAGSPFLETNDIALRPARKQIIIRGTDIVPYSQTL